MTTSTVCFRIFIVFMLVSMYGMIRDLETKMQWTRVTIHEMQATQDDLLSNHVMTQESVVGINKNLNNLDIFFKVTPKE